MASRQTDNFQPPPWIKPPKLGNCGLKVFKGGEKIDTITEIGRKSFVLFGRNAQMSDIKLDHPSISRRHALMGHGSSGNLYVMDLGSSHGTFVNAERLKKRKREPLRDGYTVKFGASTREYIVKLDLDADDDDGLDTKSNPKKRKLEQSQTANGAATAKRAKTSGSGTGSGEKISCRHLLVKHRDSRRPKSWKSEEITRSKEEAMAMIKEYRGQIMAAVDGAGDGDKEKVMSSSFVAIAGKESDCSSYKRGGNLGAFGRNKMQKPFEDAAFALEVGQLSDPVVSDSGIHLILRYE